MLEEKMLSAADWPIPTNQQNFGHITYQIISGARRSVCGFIKYDIGVFRIRYVLSRIFPLPGFNANVKLVQLLQ